MINPSHLKLTLSSILFQQWGSSCLCIMRVAVTHWWSQSHSRFGRLKEHLAPLCLTPMSARDGVMEEPNSSAAGGGFLLTPASVASLTPLQLAHFRHHCHHPHSCVVLCCLTVTQTSHYLVRSRLCAVGIRVLSPSCRPSSVLGLRTPSLPGRRNKPIACLLNGLGWSFCTKGFL